MDKDNLFKAVLYAAVAFLIWNFVVKFWISPPQPQETAQSEPSPVVQPRTSPGAAILDQLEESYVELGSIENSDHKETENKRRDYRMHLKLSTRSAGIVSAWLSDYKKTVAGDERYQLLAPVEIPGYTYYSLETFNLTLNAGDDDVGNDIVFQLGQANWRVTKTVSDDGERAVFTTDLAHNGVPTVRVIKTFFLPKQAQDTRHSDLELTLAFENLTTEPISVQATQWGPMGVEQEDPRSDYRRISAGVYKSGQLDITAEQPANIKDFSFLADADPNTSVEWAAMANKFFAVIMAPVPAADGQPWIADAFARHLADPEDELNDTTFQLVTSVVNVAPGARIERAFDCYLGPKSKKTFATVNPYVGRNYVSLINVDYYMCAWTWIVNLMLWLLSTVQSVWPHNYGLAIIVMVLVVRFMLHPLTKKGQVNMARMAEQMQALQPKMEEIRRKYEGDRQRINQETMKVYQTEGVNPAGQMFGCLPMFCQLPIWAALWAALQTTVELRHEPFCLWINDLTTPDHLVEFGQSYPLIGNAFNLLPPLLGISMWLQNKYMPKPASANQSSTQATQQKMMMTMMSVMMVVFFYNAPSGLTLYIMSSNFFGLFEQWRIRKHIAEEKARDAAAGTESRFQKPKWIQKLENLAEQAREQQQQQQKKKKK